MRGVVAVGLNPALADLQQEFSVLGEFEDMPVAVTVAGEPDIVVRIDEDAVLAASGTAVAIGAPLFRAGLALDMSRVETAAIEPLILAGLRWPAPALEVFAVGAELDDGRRGAPAVLGGVAFLERVRAMDHPDIAVRIRGRAAHAAEQHLVRHGGELVVDFEDRDSDRFLGLCGGVKTADDSRKRGRRQHSTRDDVLSHVTAPPDRAIVCSSDTIAL